MYIYIYIYQSILINQSINQSNSISYIFSQGPTAQRKNRDAMDAANHAQAHVGPCPARAMRTVRTGAGPEGAPEQWP